MSQKSLNRCESDIDCPNWLKDKQATINPKNKDDKMIKSFQYV